MYAVTYIFLVFQYLKNYIYIYIFFFFKKKEDDHGFLSYTKHYLSAKN